MHPSVATLLGFVVGILIPVSCLVGLAHLQGIDTAHLDLIAGLMKMAVTGLLPINILLGGILGVLLSLATR